MRVAFVDNILIQRHGDGVDPTALQPHLGLISLIAVLEAAGHQGLLFDPKLALSRGELSLNHTLYEKIALDVLRLEPDVVGLTSLGCNFVCTLNVAAHLK